MPRARRPSRWRDDRTWDLRLQQDQRLINERLDNDQRDVLDESRVVVNNVLPVHFVLVVGSRARGDHRPDSDLDMYLEALGAPDDPADAPAVPHPHFNLLITPAGTLINNVRDGEALATAFAHEGLVAFDNGAFRETLIAIDEEGLL